ncbi:lasso peptide biosynthesis B2 protein [Amycolatopsis sp. NBC_00345]|uniref:lasso peptide biosynthesis B2 protein n=1 Tax=Amycolatopsis sp. NBC_00345 TaxID=2975955 RepID=UPI002E26569E
MTGQVTLETATETSLRWRITARCAVLLARGLAELRPRPLRKTLEVMRRGAKPADLATAARARNSVVAVSPRCGGPWCLQRSIAAALVCRSRGTWPDWCAGVRTEPFAAHAWIVAAGTPVGEDSDEIERFHITLSVPGARG